MVRPADVRGPDRLPEAWTQRRAPVRLGFGRLTLTVCVEAPSVESAVVAVTRSEPPFFFRRLVTLLESVTVTGVDFARGRASVIVRIAFWPAIFALSCTRQPRGAVAGQLSVKRMLVRRLLSLIVPIVAR